MPVWRIVVPKDGSQCARPVHVEQHRTPHHALVDATTEDLCEDQGLYKFSPSSRSWP